MFMCSKWLWLHPPSYILATFSLVPYQVVGRGSGTQCDYCGSPIYSSLLYHFQLLITSELNVKNPTPPPFSCYTRHVDRWLHNLHPHTCTCRWPANLHTPCSHNTIADIPCLVGLLCRHHSFCPVLYYILQTEQLSCCLWRWGRIQHMEEVSLQWCQGKSTHL